MHDTELEKRIINTFALTYRGLKNGMHSGSLPLLHQVELIDQMAICFRDYVELQRSTIGAQMAIEKAKQA